MNRRIQIGIGIAVVGIALAGLGIFFLSRMFSQVFVPVALPTTPPLPMEKVVVLTHDVPMGTALKSEDLTLTDMPVQAIPRGAMKQLEAVIGRMTTAAMVNGEIVLAHRLADPTNIAHDIAFTLTNQQVLIAFPAEDLMSSLNVIQRGDLVDIMATITANAPVVSQGTPEASTGATAKETAPEIFTFFAMQRLGITAMVMEVVTSKSSNTINPDGAQPTPSPSQQHGNVEAYLLAVSPQDALVLKHLIDENAKFDFALRSPTSTELFDVEPVIPQYMVDRYQLQIKR